MTCPHVVDVAVYVLGALDPAERAEFEAHLAGCGGCSAALAESAALPGLLARAPMPTADDDGPGAAPPPELLAGVVHRVRRRRRATRAVLVAAAVLLVALGTGLGLLTTTTPAASREVALPAVAGSPSSGTAGLAARPWGTQIALACRTDRAGSPPTDPGAARRTYTLVVTTADGRQETVARWSPPPGADVQVTAATDLPPDRIAALEVRGDDGRTVMRSA